MLRAYELSYYETMMLSRVGEQLWLGSARAQLAGPRRYNVPTSSRVMVHQSVVITLYGLSVFCKGILGAMCCIKVGGSYVWFQRGFPYLGSAVIQLLRQEGPCERTFGLRISEVTSSRSLRSWNLKVFRAESPPRQFP